ncbi:MAG: RsmE family RNA methyltransferase [Bacteroidetes bacterium]|nr:RsmE family RNA methyltransferase [Bacteroidota bacterium]
MMDRFFYAPPESFSDSGEVLLPPDESKHAVKVLRLGVGDEMMVVDGQGFAAQVEIMDADRTAVYGRILSTYTNLGEPPLKLTIGLSLLNRERRYHVFLEKAVELGVTSIIPMMCARTQFKGDWREDRGIHVMKAAMKQCQRSRFPELHRLTSFENSVKEGSLIADHRADLSISEVINPSDDDLRILVGPEGGFTDDERTLAISRGAITVNLGRNRLRAETAAICCATIAMISRMSHL